MEATESPLDVLSRAATMLQENQQSLSHTDDGPKDCSNKQLPTTKWKRERRNRLPEYSRIERNGESSNGDYQNYTSSENPVCSTNGSNLNGIPKSTPKETPIDMSVRQRGLPPSYAQTISNPGFRSNYRIPTIVNGVPPPVSKEEIPAGVNPFNDGISMCDPIIDEHFRRSLGENYQTLLMNNNIPKETIPTKSTSPPAPVAAKTTPCQRKPSPPRQTQSPSTQQIINIKDLMGDTGMSVDDHFAKALGDTWVKLNKNKQEIKSNTSENQNAVSI